MDFIPKENAISVDYLTTNSILNKVINLEDLVPVTEDDVHKGNLYNRSYPYDKVDFEMVYYNKTDQQYLIFLKEGTWNQENLNHNKLDFYAFTFFFLLSRVGDKYFEKNKIQIRMIHNF